MICSTKGIYVSSKRLVFNPSDDPVPRAEGFHWQTGASSSSYLLILIFPTVFTNSERTCDKDFIIRRAATNRVLNVLRHWVSKHSQVCVRLPTSVSLLMIKVCGLTKAGKASAPHGRHVNIHTHTAGFAAFVRLMNLFLCTCLSWSQDGRNCPVPLFAVVVFFLFAQ